MTNPCLGTLTRNGMETSCRILTKVILFVPPVTEFRVCG